MKTCRICNQEKNESEFYSRTYKYGIGLRTECKLCNNKNSKNNREKNLDNNRANIRNYYYNNKQARCEYYKKWRAINETKEDVKARWNNYTKNNPERIRKNSKIKEAKRRAAKLKRTPKWANLEAIKEIYKNCPDGMHVDHIIPLQGKLISGLHVEYNLQYLTKSENSKKNNKYEPEIKFLKEEAGIK